MAQRKDGKKTRSEILEAACDVFAAKGYQKTTVAEICKRAGVNIAAVNYHFGDKASLYTESWQHAHDKCRQLYPLNIDNITDVSPEERLRTHIFSLIRVFCDDGRLGQFHQMHLLEMANPSGLIDDIWRKIKEPFRLSLIAVIRELIGADADDEAVLLCEASVINQCRGLLAFNRRDLDSLRDLWLTPEKIEEIADHITRFSLGGIRAVGNR